MYKKNKNNIAVIGAGISGYAIALFAKEKGTNVFISDSNDIRDEYKKKLASLKIDWEENGNSEKLLKYDKIIVSSGVSPNNKILQKAKLLGVPVIGEIDFVYPYLSGKIIAITGSNGKTTVASMFGFLLEKLGYKIAVCGNIGNPVSEVAKDKYDFIILELSSFQLYWTKKFNCDVGIVTNLAPDHIDWHGSYENYLAAKANIIECVVPDGLFICQRIDMKALKADDIEFCLPFSYEKPNEAEKGVYLDSETKTAWLKISSEDAIEKLFDFKKIKLLGKHNLMNMAMVLAAINRYNIKVSESLASLYIPPKHRCSYVGSVNSISFVNDSKGTNVAASITALKALEGPKIVILGGQGKGESYTNLAEVVRDYAKYALLIGSEKEKIARALSDLDFGSFDFASNMNEAVEKAYLKASPGDTILLSPACASWDMYKDFKERGEEFCLLAKAVIKREGDRIAKQ